MPHLWPVLPGAPPPRRASYAPWLHHFSSRCFTTHRLRYYRSSLRAFYSLLTPHHAARFTVTESQSIPASGRQAVTVTVMSSTSSNWTDPGSNPSLLKRRRRFGLHPPFTSSRTMAEEWQVYVFYFLKLATN